MGEENVFDIVADRLVADISRLLEEKPETRFGAVARSPGEAANDYLRKTPEARRTFQSQVSTEEMLKIAERIVAKRGQFHA